MPNWVITIDAKIWLSFIAMFIIQIVSFTAFVVKLDARIGTLEDFVSAGDRFTSADGELLRQELNFYKIDVAEIKADLKVIKERVTNSPYHW